MKAGKKRKEKKQVMTTKMNKILKYSMLTLTLLTGCYVVNAQYIPTYNGVRFLPSGDTLLRCYVSEDGDTLIIANNDTLTFSQYLTSETDPIYSSDSVNIVRWNDTIYYLATKSEIPNLKSGTEILNGGYDTCYFVSSFPDTTYTIFADGYISPLESVEVYILQQNTDYFSVYTDVACTMKWHADGKAVPDTTTPVPPLIVTPVYDETIASCLFTDQSSADTDFADWLDGFAVSGGCDPSFVTSPVSPSAPDYCGGVQSVTWTVTDNCYTTTNHTATFTITAPVLIVNEVDDYSVASSSFTSQADADADFANWLDDFSVSGGCDPSYTTSPASPSAPSYTAGGSTEVTWTVIDTCYTTSTHTATYTITTAPPDWYGVYWLTTQSNPDVTRIASDMDLHKANTSTGLPVQNGMKACILEDDGDVAYYLDEDDWDYKADGVTASNLDGTDGQVMIEIPEHWIKWETSGDTVKVKMAVDSVAGFEKQRKLYVSAYEAAIYRPDSILASVVNTSTDYRGGNNDSTWDALTKTYLGRPVGDFSRSEYRNMAQERGSGWQIYTYEAHNAITWLFVVEYATRNSQKAVNTSLDANSYRQGGLGNGVTTTTSAKWNSFNSYCIFIPCGVSNNLASNTGEVSYSVAGFDAFKVNRYRGVEIPFGHMYKFIDGNVVIVNSSSSGNTTLLYTSPNLMRDSITTGMTYIGNVYRNYSYIRNIRNKSIMATQVGASGSTYFCDWTFHASIPSSGTEYHAVVLGGQANNNVAAGLFFTNYGTRYNQKAINFTTRLTYIP